MRTISKHHLSRQWPEFINRELDLWAFLRGVTLDFSRPGKPTDNAFIESMNGKFRAECLNANWFMSNEVPAALHRSASNPGQLAAR